MSFDLDPLPDSDSDSGDNDGTLPATRADLDEKHGKRTVDEMADLNNSRSPTLIASRVLESLRYGRDCIADVLAIPDPPTRMMKNVAVALASAWLNGFPSKDDPDGFQRQIANELAWAQKQLEVWRTTQPGAVDAPAPVTKGITVVKRVCNR